MRGSGNGNRTGAAKGFDQTFDVVREIGKNGTGNPPLLPWYGKGCGIDTSCSLLARLMALTSAMPFHSVVLRSSQVER